MQYKSWFSISNDYRSGFSLYSYNKCPDNDSTEAFKIEFDGPDTDYDYRLHLVKTTQQSSVWHLDFALGDFVEDIELQDIYHKAFSQIHDCLPFVTTGYTCSYKEEGHYPDIPAKLKDMECIFPDDVIESITEGDDWYFIFIADSDGDVVLAKMIFPVC